MHEDWRPHLKWRPTVHNGQVLQSQTGDEREYPVGFCKEYAKAAGLVLGSGGSFLEVFSGPNAPLSVEVGALLGAPVPGYKLENKGKGDKVELQNLSQLLGSHPLVSQQASSFSARAAPTISVQESFYRDAALNAARQPGYGKRTQLIQDGLQDPSKHMEEALKLSHPFTLENVLKPDHREALDSMPALETNALRDRMKTLVEWKVLATSSATAALQSEHEKLACECAVRLGRKSASQGPHSWSFLERDIPLKIPRYLNCV